MHILKKYRKIKSVEGNEKSVQDLKMKIKAIKKTQSEGIL